MRIKKKGMKLNKDSGAKYHTESQKLSPSPRKQANEKMDLNLLKAEPTVSESRPSRRTSSHSMHVDKNRSTKGENVDIGVMSSTSNYGRFHHSSNPSMQPTNQNRPRLHTAGGIIKHGGLSRDKMMRCFGQTNRRIKPEICGPNLTSFPYSYRSFSQNRQVVNTNLQNNKKYFEITHSAMNKTNLKENSNIQSMVKQLPSQFQSSFSNKIINDYKMQVGRIISHQKNKSSMNNNKKLIQNIKMQFICMPNDMTVRQKEI